MRVACLTALFPVHSEIPFLNQIVGLIERGHQVDIYADGPAARRRVPSRRGAARPPGAHALSLALARRPDGAVARRVGGGAGASRRGPPDAAAHPRSLGLLAPGMDARPAAPDRPLPPPASLRHLLLRLRHGRAARAPAPPARCAGWRAGRGLPGCRHHEVRCSTRAEGVRPNLPRTPGSCSRCATSWGGSWWRWARIPSGSWCTTPGSTSGAGRSASERRPVTAGFGW